jgi:YHS domain-containing protein
MKNTLFTFVILIITGYTTFSQQSAIFQTNGKAIRGYDVVAYFNDGQPVKGNDSLTYQWGNSSWLFSSLTNLELFKQNPEQYVPEYGGYCAYGTAGGYKAPTQPDAWAIVNGKLYFNYNLKVKASWDKDRVGYISKADKNWPLIKNK